MLVGEWVVTAINMKTIMIFSPFNQAGPISGGISGEVGQGLDRLWLTISEASSELMGYSPVPC